MGHAAQYKLDIVASDESGSTQADTDPAAAWRNRKERRAAWEAWEQSGGTLDTLPPGLVSASLDAAMKREGAPGPRWRR